MNTTFDDPEVLGAFNRIWYEKIDLKELTDTELEKLLALYKFQPFKSRNFRDWARREVRNHYIKYIEELNRGCLKPPQLEEIYG